MKAFILKSIYPLFLLFILSYIKGVSQDLIILKDSTVIESKISEVSKTLIKYRKASDTTDLFLETDQLRSLKIGDTTYVIYPASLANKRSMIATADFRKSLLNQDYAYLLHSVTILQDANFAKGKIEILLASRTKLLPLIDILKSNKSVKYVLAVHTDTVGKTITNLTLSKKRATYLRNFFIANGVKPENISAEGKGESEPLYFSQATLAFNRRVEIRVTAVEKTKVLYAEKYVRPQIEVNTPQKQEEKQEIKQKIKKEENGKQPVRQKVSTKEKNHDFTLGFDASQIIPIGEPQWTDENKGFGLKRTIGASLRYTRQCSSSWRFTAEIGFINWTSAYHLKNDTALLFIRSFHLTRLPIGLGFKFYLNKKLYLSPKVHVEGRRFRRSVDGLDSFPTYAITQHTLHWGGSGSIGYEVVQNDKWSADLSAGYSYTAKALPFLDYGTPPRNPLHLLSIRLGLGIR